jgi:hypothetical protein
MGALCFYKNPARPSLQRAAPLALRCFGIYAKNVRQHIGIVIKNEYVRLTKQGH